MSTGSRLKRIIADAINHFVAAQLFSMQTLHPVAGSGAFLSEERSLRTVVDASVERRIEPAQFNTGVLAGGRSICGRKLQRAKPNFGPALADASCDRGFRL